MRKHSDIGLTAEQLDDKYNPDGDGEHPLWTRETWIQAVCEQDTLRGYWDWVTAMIKQSGGKA